METKYKANVIHHHLDYYQMLPQEGNQFTQILIKTSTKKLLKSAKKNNGIQKKLILCLVIKNHFI